MGSDPTGASWKGLNRPRLVLALLILLSAALLLVLRLRIGFFLDDWALVFPRYGVADWLIPHNEHIIVLPAAIYQLSLSVFGMTSVPLHLLALTLFLTSVVLLFGWLRPLVGEAAAVIGCAVLLFLGVATEDLIWAFQMGFFGSAATGLGALLLLRRGSRADDLWACLLLVVSLLFSSLAIPFAVGAAVQLLFREGRLEWASLWRRLWVVALPGLLYIGWWLGWGHEAATHTSLDNLLRDPFYVLSALAYAAASLTGLFPLRELTMSLVWSIPGLDLVGGLAWLLLRRRRVPPEFLVAAAIGLTFWALSGLNYIPGREFAVSRYQYPSVIMLLMILGGACAGLRPDARQLKVMAGIAGIAVAVNIAALIYTFEDRYMGYAERNLVSLTVLDLASRTVAPDFGVGISLDDRATIDAKTYFSAVDRYGSPALTESEIEDASAENRTRLDQYLVLALPVSLPPARDVIARPDTCRVIEADATADRTLPVPSRMLYLRAEQQVRIWLGRFGPGAGAAAWAAPGGKPIGYVIPTDRSDRPWRIGFTGAGKVTVCAARPALRTSGNRPG